MNRRCRQEIAAIEDQIRAGNPDGEGLCLALADWSAELRSSNGKWPRKQESPPRPKSGGQEGETGNASG
jgi:hypothetical protein